MDDCHLNNITKLKAIVSPFFDLKKTLVPLKKIQGSFQNQRIKQYWVENRKSFRHHKLCLWRFDDGNIEVHSSKVHSFCTQMLCIYNTYETCISRMNDFHLNYYLSFYLYVLHMCFDYMISICKNYEPLKDKFHTIVMTKT